MKRLMLSSLSRTSSSAWIGDLGLTSLQRRKMSTVTFVGGGNMAEAIIAGIHPKGVHGMCVVDINEKRRDHLRKLFEIETFESLRNDRVEEKLKQSQVVVLAVKPQNFNAVSKLLSGKLGENTLLLSIIAGATVADLQQKCHTNFVCRSMPNTPAMIGQGMTVWTTSSSCSQEMVSQARDLLQGFGKEIFVDDEEFLDMATAISGTGPAYFLMVMESMIDTAVHMGMPRTMAKTLVEETMNGTIAYAKKSGRHPAMLRNDITSPGGTTAAALYMAEKGGFRSVLSDCIWAAYRRSREMGGNHTNVGPMGPR